MRIAHAGNDCLDASSERCWMRIRSESISDHDGDEEDDYYEDATHDWIGISMPLPIMLKLQTTNNRGSSGEGLHCIANARCALLRSV